MVGRCFQLDVPIFNPNFRHQLVDLDLLHPLRVRHFLALCLHVHLRVSFVPEGKSIELEDVASSSLTFLSLHHKNFTHWNSLWSYQPRSKEAITAFPERRSSRSCAREEVEPWCSPTDRSGSPSNRRSRNSSPHKRGSGSC